MSVKRIFGDLHIRRATRSFATSKYAGFGHMYHVFQIYVNGPRYERSTVYLVYEWSTLGINGLGDKKSRVRMV